MPVITEKWHGAAKVDGAKDEIVLPNGERLKGHYVLHEADASSPSHDPRSWQKTEGFPIDENGNTVNDRDYERDKDAQRETVSMAQDYDQRALQNPVVVSRDGVVLSGNSRTMAGVLAAEAGTDGNYIDYLREYAGKYGFTAEQVAGMQHPRVSFVPDEAMPYNAVTFAKFNAQEMKSQNKTETAVKLGKTVSDEVLNRIVSVIRRYETLGDYYADPNGGLAAVGELLRAGVITSAQLPQFVDGTSGNEKLSLSGREMLENILIGKAFESNPDAVRMLTAVPSMRQRVVQALGEISDNMALGEAWTLREQLTEAVKLCYEARQHGFKEGEAVSAYARQGVLPFELGENATAADFNNATVLMLADVLNDSRVTQLKRVFILYNDQARMSAAGQTDLFSNQPVKSREEILREVITTINNAKQKEIEAAQREAVERRKADSVQPNGDTAPSGETSEQGVRGERAGGNAGEQQSNLAQAEERTERNSVPEEKKIVYSDPREMSEEEKQRRGEMLRNAPVIDVEQRQIVASEGMSARKAAEQWWDENVPEAALYDTEVGEVEINRNSIESSLAHRYGQTKLDTITSLVEGFENAVYIGTMPDSRERGVMDHYFAYPINYGGELHYVFCRALNDNNTNRLYVHEVFLADKIKKGSTLQTAASKPHGSIALYRDILANVLDVNGKLLYRFDGGAQTEHRPADVSVTTSPLSQGNETTLLSNNSDWHLAEQQDAVPDLLPTQESNASSKTNEGLQTAALQPHGPTSSVSDGKSTHNSESEQKNVASSGVSEETNADADAEQSSEMPADITINPETGKPYTTAELNAMLDSGDSATANKVSEIFEAVMKKAWGDRVGQYNRLQRALGEVAVELLRGAGIEVVLDEAEMAEVLAAEEALRAQKMSSKDTGSPFQETDRSPVVPFNDDAKILQNLDTAKEKYEKGEKVQEVNGDALQLMTVYHGSGAAFDAFDHSHMGEGEGAQAYGWGTYVTEVEGIARTYAGTMARRGNHIRYDGEPLGDVLDNEYYFDDAWRSWKTQIMTSTDIESLRRNIQTVYLDGRIASPRSKRRKEFERQKKELLADIDNGRITINLPRNLYTVEIPEDTGKNYLDWTKKPGARLVGKVEKALQERGQDVELRGKTLYRGEQKNVEVGSVDTTRGLLATIGSELGSDKAASEFLSSLGYVGIKYPAEYMTGGRSDGAKNYVIFNEADAKITERIQFLRTAKGEVYGFVKNGKVYLDPKLLNPNTPIHEYTHLWDAALQKANPELWTRGVELMKQTPLWQEVVNNPAYADIKDDENLVASRGARPIERCRRCEAA